MSKTSLSIFAVLLVAFVWSTGVDSTQHCEEYGVKFGKGESITVPGTCEQATCLDPELSAISYEYCSQYFPSPKCHVTEADLSKQYPECCPRVVC